MAVLFLALSGLQILLIGAALGKIGEGKNPRIIEGDIILDRRMQDIIGQEVSQSVRRSKRMAVGSSGFLWPDAVVPYVIDQSIGANIKKKIRKAFRHISKRSCISFMPKKSKHKDYVKFINGNGCYSSVGKVGGEQVISLDRRECLFGAIHEVMHALGFFHEHSRPDRDENVKILWWNIQEGMQENFGNYANGVTDTLGQPYDIKSIMHYTNKAFSKNGRDTMVSIKTPWVKLGGKRKRLTSIDIAQLNQLYNCYPRGRRNLYHRTCSDILYRCSHYAIFGEACELNYDFMKHYCGKSCGFCGKR